MNNKPNKSTAHIILLSSNKQADGRSQVSDDDPVTHLLANQHLIGSFVFEY